MSYKGQILLKRKTNHYIAGFCVLHKELAELEQEVDILHPEEYTYYRSLRFDRRKESYLLGRIAAKKAISQLLDKKSLITSISIQFGVFQFPVVKYVQHQNIQVSISHCDHYGIALAFPEEHPLGIDIEKINEDKLQTLKSSICAHELDKITANSLSELIGSTLIWTIKESLSKVLKTGLTVDFKILEIESLQEVGTAYESTFVYFPQYKAVSKKVGNYICSVVLPKNTTSSLEAIWNALAATLDKEKVKMSSI